MTRRHRPAGGDRVGRKWLSKTRGRRGRQSRHGIASGSCFRRAAWTPWAPYAAEGADSERRKSLPTVTRD